METVRGTVPGGTKPSWMDILISVIYPRTGAAGKCMYASLQLTFTSHSLAGMPMSFFANRAYATFI